MCSYYIDSRVLLRLRQLEAGLSHPITHPIFLARKQLHMPLFKRIDNNLHMQVHIPPVEHVPKTPISFQKIYSINCKFFLSKQVFCFGRISKQAHYYDTA